MLNATRRSVSMVPTDHVGHFERGTSIAVDPDARDDILRAKQRAAPEEDGAASEEATLADMPRGPGTHAGGLALGETLAASTAAAAGREGASGRTIPDRGEGADPEPTLAPAPPVRRAARPPTVPGYEILSELGRGGMGVVYLARQGRLNRLCALKMILGGVHADPAAVARFLAEAELVARLKHPHVVQIHALGEHDGLPYFELEYMEGGSLDLKLDGTPWPARRAAALMEPLARAVAEAHRLDIVHRDLKPGNVLLGADGTPKLTDFGLAKARGADSGLTGTEAILGSPSYMAPEQAEGRTREAGPLADVYSLGAIFYELLTGRPPFKGATVLQTLEQVKHAEPVHATRLIPGLPRDADTIALKCLEKSPGRRYPSAGALADDLRRFLDNEPITARPVSALERIVKYARRRPALAASFVIVHVLLAALLGLGIWSYAQIRASLDEAKRARDRAEALATSEARTRASAQLISARLAHQRGRAFAEAGAVDQGLVWMGRALAMAPSNDEGTQLRDAVAASQQAWLSRLIRPRWLAAASSPARALAIDSEGKRLATGHTDGTIRLWDLTDGRRIAAMERRGDEIEDLDFLPDGRLLSLGFQSTAAVLRDGRTLARVAALPATPWGLPPPTWQSATISPAGDALLLTSQERGLGRLFRLADGGDGVPIVQDTLYASAFSRDGARLVTTSRAGTVVVRDGRTGRPLAPPIEDINRTEDVQITPDGRFAVCVSGDDLEDTRVGRHLDGRLLVIDLEAGTLAAASSVFRPGLFTVAIAPDGRTAAAGSFDGLVRTFDLPTARLRDSFAGPTGWVSALDFSPDGRFLAAGYRDGEIRLFDVVAARPVGSIVECGDDVTLLRFLPDGRSLVAVSDDGTIRCLDLDGAAPGSWALAGAREVFAGQFSPDGRTVAVAGFDGTARLYDAATGQPIGGPLAHGARIYAARFRPDGRFLATGGANGLVRIWDLATARPVGPAIGCPHWVLNIAFSPDGSTLLAGCAQGGARLWDLRANKAIGPVLFHPQSQVCEVWHVAFTPDGRHAVTGTVPTSGALATVAVWDARTGRRIGDYLRFEGTLQQLAVLGTPDGEAPTLLLNHNGRIRRFNLGTRQEVGEPFGRDTVAFAVSPDGRQLLTGGRDKKAQIWELATGQADGPVIEHEALVRGVAWRPDARLVLTITNEGRLRFWDPRSGEPIGPPLEHPAFNYRERGDDRQPVAFHPDGKLALSFGQTAQLWAVPAPPGDAEPISPTWLAALTGLDARAGVDQAIRRLDPSDWGAAIASADLGSLPPPIAGDAWAERIARASEAEGDAFGAAWHLDRLVALRPGDWSLWLRRAALREKSGDRAGAAADLDRALALAPPDRADAIRAERLEDQLATAWGERAWPIAVEALVALVRLRPHDEGLRRRLVQAHAFAGQLDAARRELEAILGDGHHALNDHILLAQLQLVTGDRPGYARTCREMTREVQLDGLSPNVLNNVAWLYALGPNTADELSGPLAHVGRMLEQDVGPSRHLYLNTYAGLLLRAGRFEEALRALNDGLAASDGGGLPQDWAFLAMAHQALGHRDEALSWLARLDAFAPPSDLTQFWNNLEIAMLRREADTLVRLDPMFPPDPFAAPSAPPASADQPKPPSQHPAPTP
jgi:WD40 repeat protein/tetratricopeptide (TPR) repeat protein